MSLTKAHSRIIEDLPNAVNSITDLKAHTTDINSIEVLGYYEAGDGGGGTFFWDASSTATDNGGTVIAATGVTTGRWTRVYSGAVNVKWFGAKGDNSTDDTTALEEAFKFKYSEVPPGDYIFSRPLIIKWHVTGLGPAIQCRFKATESVYGDYALLLQNSGASTKARGLENISVYGINTDSVIQLGDDIEPFTQGSLTNVYVNNASNELATKAFHLKRGWLYSINNCTNWVPSGSNVTGLHITLGNAINIDNGEFVGKHGLVIDAGSNMVIHTTLEVIDEEAIIVNGGRNIDLNVYVEEAKAVLFQGGEGISLSGYINTGAGIVIQNHPTQKILEYNVGSGEFQNGDIITQGGVSGVVVSNVISYPTSPSISGKLKIDNISGGVFTTGIITNQDGTTANVEGVRYHGPSSVHLKDIVQRAQRVGITVHPDLHNIVTFGSNIGFSRADFRSNTSLSLASRVIFTNNASSINNDPNLKEWQDGYPVWLPFSREDPNVVNISEALTVNPFGGKGVRFVNTSDSTSVIRLDFSHLISELIDNSFKVQIGAAFDDDKSSDGVSFNLKIDDILTDNMLFDYDSRNGYCTTAILNSTKSNDEVVNSLTKSIILEIQVPRNDYADLHHISLIKDSSFNGTFLGVINDKPNVLPPFIDVTQPLSVVANTAGGAYSSNITIYDNEDFLLVFPTIKRNESSIGIQKIFTTSYLNGNGSISLDIDAKNELRFNFIHTGYYFPEFAPQTLSLRRTGTYLEIFAGKSLIYEAEFNSSLNRSIFNLFGISNQNDVNTKSFEGFASGDFHFIRNRTVTNKELFNILDNPKDMSKYIDNLALSFDILDRQETNIVNRGYHIHGMYSRTLMSVTRKSKKVFKEFIYRTSTSTPSIIPSYDIPILKGSRLIGVVIYTLEGQSETCSGVTFKSSDDLSMTNTTDLLTNISINRTPTYFPVTSCNPDDQSYLFIEGPTDNIVVISVECVFA